jgi:hypothetical protein
MKLSLFVALLALSFVGAVPLSMAQGEGTAVASTLTRLPE